MSDADAKKNIFETQGVRRNYVVKPQQTSSSKPGQTISDNFSSKQIRGLHLLRRNAISNAIGIVVPSLAWAVVLPLMVHLLGDQQYGVYTIAASAAGLLGFLELGLTSAATKFVSEIVPSSESSDLSKIISTNIILFTALGALVTGLGLYYADGIAPILFPASGMALSEMALVVKLTGIVLSLTLLRNALSSVFFGLQRYDIYNIIQVSYAITVALTQAIVLLMGGRIVALLAATAAVMGASLIALILSIRRLLPHVRLDVVFDLRIFRALFSFGIYMMLLNLGGIILFSLDKLIVGWIFGSAGVTYYAVPSQIALRLHTSLTLLVSFLFPLSSEVQALGDRASLRNIYLRSMRAIVVIDALVMVFLGTFARDILSLWIGPEFAMSASEILIFTSMGYFILSLGIAPYHIVLGMGRPKELALLNFCATLCVLGCLCAGLILLGLLGGVICAMTSMVVMYVLPWYAQRLLGISFRTAYANSYGRPFLVALAAILASVALPQHYIFRISFFVLFALLQFAFLARQFEFAGIRYAFTRLADLVPFFKASR